MWSSTASLRSVQGRFLILFLSLSTTEGYTDRPVHCKLLICGYFYLIYHSVSLFYTSADKSSDPLCKPKTVPHCRNTFTFYLLKYSIVQFFQPNILKMQVFTNITETKRHILVLKGLVIKSTNNIKNKIYMKQNKKNIFWLQLLKCLLLFSVLYHF